jgi:hypothetical protein
MALPAPKLSRAKTAVAVKVKLEVNKNSRLQIP